MLFLVEFFEYWLKSGLVQTRSALLVYILVAGRCFLSVLVEPAIVSKIATDTRRCLLGGDARALLVSLCFGNSLVSLIRR